MSNADGNGARTPGGEEPPTLSAEDEASLDAAWALMAHLRPAGRGWSQETGRLPDATERDTRADVAVDEQEG